MRIHIHGVEYDLSFEERLVTYAVLRHKGTPIRRGAAVKHPADPYDPVVARETACLDLAKKMPYDTQVSFFTSTAGALSRWEQRIKKPWDTRPGKAKVAIWRKGKTGFVRVQ